MANKWVGKRVEVNGKKQGVVIYADRAGVVVRFDDGTEWFGPIGNVRKL